MKTTGVVGIAIGGFVMLSACAAPSGRVDSRDNLLEAPRQTQSLGEQILAESAKDGCLAPGNATDRSDRCQALRDTIAPPPPLEPIAVPPPAARPG